MALLLYPKFKATIRDGVLEINPIHREKYDRYIANLEGKNLRVAITRDRKGRSTAQNRYYRGVIVTIVAEEMGLFPEEAHEHLKDLFLKVPHRAPNGKVYQIVRSTSDLNTMQFEDYLAKCRMWASQELNSFIPLPNEVDYSEYN